MDVEHCMRILFDDSDDCVGLIKPQPNMVAVSEQHTCTCVCDKAEHPENRAYPESRIECMPSVFADNFYNIVAEVFDATNLELPVSFSFGSEKYDTLFCRLFATNENVAGNDYITRLNDNEHLTETLKKLSMQYKTLWLASPAHAFGNETFIVCVSSIDSRARNCSELGNMVRRFIWRQNQQKREFFKFQKWHLERNVAIHWEEAIVLQDRWTQLRTNLALIIAPPMAAPDYVPVSPIYKYVPVSPIYTSSRLLAQVWLDKNISRDFSTQ